MSGRQLEKSPHSGLHNLNRANFDSRLWGKKHVMFKSSAQLQYFFGMFASKNLLVLNVDAVQVTYGGTVPTNTNENSMTNACHVGLAIPGINFWQAASWHGSTGPLRATFSKGITCQELPSDLQHESPQQKESLAIQGTWWCLQTVPKPRTDYRSLRIDPGQKDEFCSVLQCEAWMISFGKERTFCSLRPREEKWMNPTRMRWLAVLSHKLKIVGTKLLFLHSTIVAPPEFAERVQF